MAGLPRAFALPYATGQRSCFSLLIDTERLKTQRGNGHFIFFSPALERLEIKTSSHPPLLPMKAKSKGAPTAVILKSDHVNSQQAKSHSASSALVPGIAHGCGTGTLASQDPAAMVLPGQQDMKSSVYTAGASQYSIHTTFIWTSLVLQCLSIHSLFLY